MTELDKFAAEYREEVENTYTVQSDIGFATWREQDDGIYIVEIFTNPDKRKKRVASTLADQCIEQAKEMGIEVKSVYGSVSMLSNTSHLSLMALTLWGMKLHTLGQDIIYFIKEIK